MKKTFDFQCGNFGKVYMDVFYAGHDYEYLRDYHKGIDRIAVAA